MLTACAARAKYAKKTKRPPCLVCVRPGSQSQYSGGTNPKDKWRGRLGSDEHNYFRCLATSIRLLQDLRPIGGAVGVGNARGMCVIQRDVSKLLGW